MRARRSLTLFAARFEAATGVPFFIALLVVMTPGAIVIPAAWAYGVLPL